MKAQALGVLGTVVLLAACAAPQSADRGRAEPGPRVEHKPRAILPARLPDTRGHETAPEARQAVHFEGASALLSPEAVATLDRVAMRLRQNPSLSARIAGTAWNRTTEEYGLALGHRRATNARDYLRASGIEDSRVATVSNGPGRLPSMNARSGGRPGDGEDIISLVE